MTYTGKPYILYEDGKHTTTPQVLSVNDKKTLYCRAQGWPKPRFRWLKDGKQVNQIKYIRTFLKYKDGKDLYFPAGVAKTDSGTYTCEAINKFGKDQYKILVLVKGLYLVCTNCCLFTSFFLYICVFLKKI